MANKRNDFNGDTSDETRNHNEEPIATDLQRQIEGLKYSFEASQAKL
jgi:hypothetical protein